MHEGTPLLEQAQLAALQGEQFFLDGQAAAVAGELAIAADDAMAGNHNWNWVRAVGQANGARGVRIADPSGQFTVRDSLPVGNFAQTLPDRELERCALRHKRQVEGFQFAGEVGQELTNSFAQVLRTLTPVRIGSNWTSTVYKIYSPQAGLVSHEH